MGNFLNQVGKIVKKAGKDVIYAALILYYTYRSSNTPVWAKSIIAGAMAYLFSPIDAIPDFTPVIGFTDDLGALLLALAQVAIFIDNDIKQQARTKMNDWFADGFDPSGVDSKI